MRVRCFYGRGIPPGKARGRYAAVPELATAYANVRAIEAKTNSERLTAQQRETVMARVRENVAASIERGDAAGCPCGPERVSHRSQEQDLER